MDRVGKIPFPDPKERTPSILIVEDEIQIRMSISDYLQECGFRVLEASNAAEAVELLDQSPVRIDLVFSDVRMPGEMDGMALSFAIKHARPNLPVVLVSSHLPDDRPHAADGFLAKPYHTADFLDLVAKMIGPEWQNTRSSRNAS